MRERERWPSGDCSCTCFPFSLFVLRGIWGEKDNRISTKLVNAAPRHDHYHYSYCLFLYCFLPITAMQTTTPLPFFFHAKLFSPLFFVLSLSLSIYLYMCGCARQCLSRFTSATENASRRLVTLKWKHCHANKAIKANNDDSKKRTQVDGGRCTGRRCSSMSLSLSPSPLVPSLRFPFVSPSPSFNSLLCKINNISSNINNNNGNKSSKTVAEARNQAL